MRHPAGRPGRSGHHGDCCCEAPRDRLPSGRGIDPDGQRQLPGLPHEVGSPGGERLEQRPGGDGLGDAVRANRVDEVAPVQKKAEAPTSRASE